MKTILKRSQSTLINIYIEPVSTCNRLAIVCNRLGFICNRLAFVCNRLAFIYNRLVFICNRLVFICNRLAFVCNRRFATRLQTKTRRLQMKKSRLQACCNIYFFHFQFVFPVRGAKKGSENGNVLNSRLHQKCSDIIFFHLCNSSLRV